MYYLSQLQECKATGLDNISASLIRLAGVHVVPPLVHIINCSIDSGTFPSTWKVAKIFSLHKSGSPHDINNFRPISILPVISKILERHVHDSFYDFLSVNNLLSKSQFGFKKGYSCFTCLSSMINEWVLQINNNNLVGFVALDFRKAFDVLPHDILLKKLKLYGCDELTIQWFHSYLYNRTQKVVINNVSSDFCDINYGVPQGSILGPLLFILFVNDISLHIKNCKIYKYADDTSLCAFSETTLSLQNKLSADLKIIEDWCINNRLVINTSKSKCMILCSHQKRRHLNTDQLQVCINGKFLENVSCQKILGVYTDKNLTWKDHINNLCKDISKLVGLLWRNKHLLPFSSRLLFYNSYILPKLDYCLPIWGKSSQTHLDKLWRLQKRAIRPLSHLINLHSHSSSITLRSNSSHCMLQVPFPHKELFKQSFLYSAPILWNTLPNHIRLASSFNIFKQQCNHYVLVDSNLPV